MTGFEVFAEGGAGAENQLVEKDSERPDVNLGVKVRT